MYENEQITRRYVIKISPLSLNRRRYGGLADTECFYFNNPKYSDVSEIPPCLLPSDDGFIIGRTGARRQKVILLYCVRMSTALATLVRLLDVFIECH